MKTRASFVANSSSSSFIVGSPVEIKSADDIITQWMGGRTEPIPHPYPEYSPITSYDVKELAEYLFKNFTLLSVDLTRVPTILESYFTNGYYDEREAEDIVDEIVQDTLYDIRHKYKADIIKAFETHFKQPYYGNEIPYSDQRIFEFRFLKENHLEEVEQTVSETLAPLKSSAFTYQAEFGDESHYEGGIEHNNVLWDILPLAKSISNH